MNPHPSRPRPLASTRPWQRLAAAALVAGAASAWAGEGFSAGIDVRPTATAAELGLAVYPGAVPRTDKDDDTTSANFRLWGGVFGMRLVVMKLHSDDSPDKVAAFYRSELARHGALLDCSGPRPAKTAAEKARDKDLKTLTCDDDATAANVRLYKAGTSRSQHIVHIEADAKGSKFEAVRLELRGD